MKTKEQAAQLYVDNIIKNYPFNNSKEAQKSAIKCDFLAGVEFANKWINVCDELPPIGEVGTKRKYIKYLVKCIKDAKYDYSLSEYTKYGFENCANVIAWRLIEL